MTTQEIIQLDKQYYMNTFGNRFPVCFEYGEDCTLYDKDNNAYTDYFSGIAVNILGYNHKAYVEKVCNQVKRLIHCSSLYYIEQQSLLAKALAENSCCNRVFFSNSGAEANEGAIKLARKYFYDKGESRYEVITAQNSFHGRTLATLAATGQHKYQQPYAPLTPSFVNVAFAELDAIKSAVNEKTCAVMLETIQGEGGVIPASAEYLKGVEALCRENGILLILDEIQTGMGRTGKLFSYQHFGIEPDIITIAKALGNGIPIGAILAKEEAAQAFSPGDHGSTFGGNPLACTAGLAVMHELMQNGLLKRMEELGAYMMAGLTSLAASHKSIKEVRGLGMLIGIELMPNVSAKDIAKNALKDGIIIGTAGQNTLRIAPPAVITEKEIDKLMAYLASVL